MDPEQTFLRVHARVSGMLSQLLTPRIRLALEYAYLAFAIALFGLLVVMHTNFVQQVGLLDDRPRFLPFSFPGFLPFLTMQVGDCLLTYGVRGFRMVS